MQKQLVHKKHCEDGKIFYTKQKQRDIECNKSSYHFSLGLKLYVVSIVIFVIVGIMLIYGILETVVL